MVEPKRAHWATAKHILMYLQGTIDYGLSYNKGKDIKLSGFTNADWAGSSVDRKSNSRYYLNIGSGITSCCSRKQKFVALSSSEAEYMAASTTSCEAIWLRELLVNLFRRNMEVTRIICDNQSCIKLSENPVFHDRSKHIDIQCHFVRDCVQRGAVQLSYTPTGEQVANILTKALGKSKFDYFTKKMGMEKGPTAAQMQRELQCRRSIGRKDQQQHKCRGSCSADAVLGERTNSSTDAEEVAVLGERTSSSTDVEGVVVQMLQ
eukprot:PITA_01826